MNRFRASVLFAIAFVQILVAGTASAAETAIQARLVVRDNCPVAASDFRRAVGNDGQQESFFLPILASIAGSLASSGISALAGSIESAASEHTFKATATTGFTHGKITRSPRGGLTPFAYQEAARCLVIAVPDPSTRTSGRRAPTPLANLGSAVQGVSALESTAAQDGLIDVLGGTDGFRLQSLPLVYAEVAIIPSREGSEIVPLLVWYRKQLPGATSRSQRAELHVALATPGYAADGDPIGSVYAFSRFELSRLRPSNSQVLVYDDMRFSNPIFHASRPTGDAIKAVPSRYNGVIATLETKKAELAKARADLAVALAKVNDEDNAVNRNAVSALEAAVGAAEAGVRRADAAFNNLPNPTSADLLGFGRTNARASFVVIRDERKFLAAIAKALGAQAETVGSEVSGLIAPKAEWEETDTAYVAASTELAAAQRALQVAIDGGDTNVIAAAQGAVLVAQAKLNEAAVKSGRPAPYPDIITDS